jgi:hypothetical protein
MTSSCPSLTPLRFSENLSTEHIRRASGKGCALLLLLSLNGCAQNNAFSPPPDGEQVTITVKVPPNLAAEPMQVIYRSEKCLLKRSGRDCSSYDVHGSLPDHHALATTTVLKKTDYNCPSIAALSTIDHTRQIFPSRYS